VIVQTSFLAFWRDLNKEVRSWTSTDVPLERAEELYVQTKGDPRVAATREITRRVPDISKGA
jgi:hypothetical protein